MSLLLETPQQYYITLLRLIQNSSESIITTFGVFCGITYNADISAKFPSKDREFLDSIADYENLDVVVGVGGFTPYKKNCDDCLLSYARRTLRIEKHRELYPKINWYLCESLHSKVSAFKLKNGKYIAIIGSRNFTGSNNFEIAVPIEDQSTAKSLFEYAQKIKSMSKKVELDTVIESVVNNTNGTEFLNLI